jgi:hypothetical protein
MTDVSGCKFGNNNIAFYLQGVSITPSAELTYEYFTTASLPSSSPLRRVWQFQSQGTLSQTSTLLLDYTEAHLKCPEYNITFEGALNGTFIVHNQTFSANRFISYELVSDYVLQLTLRIPKKILECYGVGKIQNYYFTININDAATATINYAYIECPPIPKTANYGIALSGGGSVAFSGSIGFFRGLLSMKSQLPYFFQTEASASSVSGSSWLCSQLFYSKLSTDELLGDYLPPEKCTLDALASSNKSNGQFAGQCIVNINIVNTMLSLILRYPANQLWIQAISKIFLEPYQLTNALVESPQLPISDVNQIPASYQIIQNTRGPDFPSSIINGTLAQPEYSTLGYVSVYFSDTTTGVSATIPSSTSNTSVGGVLVQSFSGGCDAVSSCPTQTYQNVSMPKTQPYFTLADMTGISSSAFVVEVEKIFPLKGLIPIVNLWSPISLVNVPCEMGDGGINSSAGVLALLAQSMKKVFLFYTRTQSDSPTTLPTLQKLFGVYPTTTSSSDPNPNSIQVFDKADYTAFQAQIESTYASGGPTWSRMTLNVLENTLNSVPGNYAVDFTVLVTNPCSNYSSLLPEETQKAILTPAFPSFPNYPLVFANSKTNILSLTLAQINLLANYVQWAVTTDPLRSVLLDMYSSSS